MMWQVAMGTGMTNALATSYVWLWHLLFFPLESPTDFMCIEDEKITYSAGALK
jgi:hypothetical protein